MVAANDKTSGSLNPEREDSQSSLMLLSVMPTMVPKVGHSRVPPITAGQHFQVSLMVLLKSPECQSTTLVYEGHLFDLIHRRDSAV